MMKLNLNGESPSRGDALRACVIIYENNKKRRVSSYKKRRIWLIYTKDYSDIEE